MKKSDWQYIVDALLFMCITGVAIIWLLMGLVIAKGPQSSESAKYFLGLHRHQWGNIHFYLFISFVGLVIIHLILSWSWIKSKARQLFHRGWAAGLVLTTIVSFLVLLLFSTFHTKAFGAYEDYGVRAGSRVKAEVFAQNQYSQQEKTSTEKSKEYLVITGQMTLLDVEKATGIPAREIADELGLPSKVSLDETLGQLRKKYSFTIQEVRAVVIELVNKKISLTPGKKELEETQRRKEQEMKIKKEARPKELLHKEQKQKLTRGRMATVPSGILITGRMTLHDLEDTTGISARKIAEELGIPSNAPINEHLGRLRRRYRFTMQEVRDAVAYLMKKK